MKLYNLRHCGCAVVLLLAILTFVSPYDCLVMHGAESRISHPNPGQLSLNQIDQLLKSLKASTFQNVKFNFSIVETKKQAGDEKAVPVFWSNGTMTVSGQLNSLIKVSYNRYTSVWLNGASPYMQKEQSFAYNGQYWITLVNKSGPINSLDPIRRAEISEKCPKMWEWPRWGTGENFFVNYAEFSNQLQPFNNLTLQQLLSRISSAPMGDYATTDFLQSFSISEEEGNLVKVSLKLAAPINTTTEMWLDMEKGGALKKYKYQHLTSPDKGWRIIEDIVEEYAHKGNNWFPTKAKRVLKTAEKEVAIDFVASNYEVVNDAANLYETSLEPGTHVTDARTNASFVVGRDIDETARIIRANIKCR
jgi:hypothetical protein